jgi:hypothetical protein
VSVRLATAYAWLTSVSIVVLVPLDVFSTLTFKREPAVGYMWNVAYWSTQVRNTALRPACLRGLPASGRRQQRSPGQAWRTSGPRPAAPQLHSSPREQAAKLLQPGRGPGRRPRASPAGAHLAAAALLSSLRRGGGLHSRCQVSAPPPLSCACACVWASRPRCCRCCRRLILQLPISPACTAPTVAPAPNPCRPHPTSCALLPPGPCTHTLTPHTHAHPHTLTPHLTLTLTPHPGAPPACARTQSCMARRAGRA